MLEEERMTANSTEATGTTEAQTGEVEGASTASESQPTRQDIDRLNAALSKERGLRRELEQQQRASMTDAQRALAEAEAKGRTAANQQFGTRLARTQFDAVAARRNPDFDTVSALEFVDMTRFVSEDGEVDDKAIKAAVERLVPAPAGGTPSYDGGSRSTSKGPTDMNAVIRKAAGRG